MARSLNVALDYTFRGDTFTNGCDYHRGNFQAIRRKYMEIPIKEDIFELPVFALDCFYKLVEERKDLSIEAISAMLYTENREPRYKSLNRYMCDIIIQRFDTHRLVKCEVKQGNETITYYGTHGAVFDKHINPIMLCTWLMERVWRNEEAKEYRFLKPIIHISPDCYISQTDPMQRWVARKAATTGLMSPVHAPFYVPEGFSRAPSDERDLTVEISECPFKIKIADVPSISTTNESLLQVVIDHIEEALE